MTTFAGMPVYLDTSLVDVHVRVKKWRRKHQGPFVTYKKRVRRTVTPKEDIYKFGDSFVMHPAIWEKLKEQSCQSKKGSCVIRQTGNASSEAVTALQSLSSSLRATATKFGTLARSVV